MSKDIMISLAEPVKLLKHKFRELAMYVAEARLTGKPVHILSMSMEQCMDYNCEPFMSALLNDIFDDSTLSYDDHSNPILNDIPRSTRILINDGLNEDVAKEIAVMIFKDVVATIGHFIPDVNFSGDGMRFNFCNDQDLLVSGNVFDEHDSDNEILRNDIRR